MNVFDSSILTYVNQFAHHTRAFDKFIGVVAANHLLKGGVLATVIWWAWFKAEDNHARQRQHIIVTLFGCIAAIASARALALLLPLRLRPLHVEELHFVLPYGVVATAFDGWSSFPSDHATLFFALAAGLVFVSRRAGICALCYTALIIALPRVYLGFHYPTDIIAGALIGTVIALLGNIWLVNNKNIDKITRWSYAQPYLFYPLLFLLTYQIADMFDSSRILATAVLKLAKAMVL